MPDGYKISSQTSDVNKVLTHGDRIYAVCNKTHSGLYFDYTKLISVISPDIMVCVTRDMFAETDIISETVYDLIIMTRDEDAEPKITVTLAYADRTDEVLLAAISFNRQNEQYRIVFKDYSIYNSPEDMTAGENKFNAKINEIIWEELDLYFEGAVTAETAAGYIQNRVTTYINERFG